jgi:maleate cis-trans isomerase
MGMAIWQPDGWAPTRIGVLTPHADIGPESEFAAMASRGVSIHATRVLFGAYKPGGAMDPTIAGDPVRAFADPPLVDDAAGFRSVGVIQALEEILNRPVLTANQVAFWQALALSESRLPVIGYGQIFGIELSSRAV